MFKYLEPIKQFNVDEKTTNALCNKAFAFYQTRSSSVFSPEQTEQDNIIISSFIRFFKCINSSKKIDEEFFQNYLKNEVFKGKPSTIEHVFKYVKEILNVQANRLLFEVTDLSDSLKHVPMKQFAKGRNIRKIVNFEYKIEVVVSNTFSNRVLLPQIYFIFTFDNGTTLKTQISIRLFNEFRKNLALNIKKIIQNEGVPLLK